MGDTAKDFATAVITVLSNPKKRLEMERQARKYVIEQLSPEKTYQPFIHRIYHHLNQDKFIL